MKRLIIPLIFAGNMAWAASSPWFGVYRGQISNKQSCTLSILENKENQVVSFLIDQNPYIFVSSSELLKLLSQRTSKINLSSVEHINQDFVEIVFDPKAQQIEVTTNAQGVVAKCSKAFQIRKQD